MWLADWKCIANVDAAVCSRADRPSFHTMLQSMSIANTMPDVKSELLFANWVLKRRLLVQDVNFSDSFARESAIQLKFLEWTGGHITSFHLNCISCSAYLMWNIALHCPRLRKLYLHNMTVSEVIAPVFMRCNKITTLQCRSISDTSLQIFTLYCPDVESIEVTESYHFSMSTLRPLTKLREVMMPTLSLSNLDLHMHFATLQTLVLHYATNANLTALLTGCLGIVSFSARMEEVTCISLIVKNWLHLRSLMFQKTNFAENVMTDKNVLKLIRGCNHLEILQVGGHDCVSRADRQLSDSTSASLLTTTSVLKILQVHTLSVPTMQAILVHCPRLEVLSVAAVDAHPKVLDVIAHSFVKHLRFGKAARLTSAQCALLKNLHSLQLEFDYSPAVSDDLVTLARNSPHLCKLNVLMHHSWLGTLHTALQHCALLRELVVTCALQHGETPAIASVKALLCGLMKSVCPKLTKIELSF